VGILGAVPCPQSHMEVAGLCRKIFTEQFPAVAEALEWDGAARSDVAV